MSDEKDPYIGEIYEDRDPRSAGRRVKVVSKSAVPGEYVVRRYTPGYNLGRRSIVSAANLERRFRKVSH